MTHTTHERFASAPTVLLIAAGALALLALLANSLLPRISHAAGSTLLSDENYAVLGATTITNTGSTTINGDVGLSPGTSVTGFPPGLINGTPHYTDTSAAQAKTDLVTVYNTAAGATPVSTVPTELGGTSKDPGAYNSASGTFGINGTLTLDAHNDPNAVFIFKTASTLITGGASSVRLVNGAQACNVFWQVGSSATLGTNSALAGNILALSDITLTTGASVQGRVFARNGAVTLDTNTITKPGCTVVPPAAPAPVVSTTGTSGGYINNTPPASIPAPTPVPAAVLPASAVTTAVAPMPSFPNTGLPPEGE